MDLESIKFLCVCGETHTPAAWSAVSWSFSVGFTDGIIPSRASAIRETWRDVKFSADFLPFPATGGIITTWL